MPADQARRGRPKGSGLDDTDYIRRVARMLEADPKLKPTTAIKAIGISDPSTIRRLRDKLRSTGEDGANCTSVKSDRGAAGGMHRAGGVVNAAQRFVAPFPKGAESPAAIAMTAGVEAQTPAPRGARRDVGVSWMQAWCALGLYAFSMTVEAQMAAFEGFLSVPEIASAIGQQAALSEQVMAFYSHDTDVQTTLH